MALLLVVDDDSHIREVMCFALRQAGHEVLEAADGAEGFRRFQERSFELVVLDIVMPEDDGLQLCRKIRKQSKVPLIFVSSRDDELDRVLGLELGGDDYIAKPFSPRELVARVGAILRRARDFEEADPDSHPPLQHGPLLLDTRRHLCRVGSENIVLTVTEFALLRALVGAPGRVFSRAQLVETGYGAGHYITDRTVDSHVRRIRKKLGEHAEMVETVYGVGYRLRE